MIYLTETRKENSSLSSLPLEIYIAGVVASEIGTAPIEACKAQAIAARTNAMPYVLNCKPISDTSVQAFRADRLDKNLYPNAYKGAGDTAEKCLLIMGRFSLPLLLQCIKRRKDNLLGKTLCDLHLNFDGEDDDSLLASVEII